MKRTGSFSDNIRYWISAVCCCAHIAVQNAFLRTCRMVNLWLPRGVITYWSIGPARWLPPPLPPFHFSAVFKDRCWFMLHICGCGLVRRGSSGAWGGWDWFERMINLLLNVSCADGAKFCIHLREASSCTHGQKMNCRNVPEILG